MSDEKQALTGKEEMSAQAALLKALQEKPSTYEIDVIDPKPLPDNLKKKKQIILVIKPPTMETLSRVAEISMKIPEKVRTGEVEALESMAYTKTICEILAVLSEGYDKNPWYPDFLFLNITPTEALKLWQETTLKLRTDFFLPFIQSVESLNPMRMKIVKKKKKTKGSTPS